MKKYLLQLRAFLALHRLKLLIGLAGLLVLGLGYTVLHQRPRQFSYSGNNCFRDITLLPGLHHSTKGTDFTLSFKSTRKLFGRSIFSTQTCIKPRVAPRGSSSAKVGLVLAGIPAINKQFTVSVPAPPKLKAVSLGPKISVRDDIRVAMDQGDKVFGYQLQYGDKTSPCQAPGSTLICSVNNLGLAQKQQYKLAIVRTFNGKVVGMAMQKTLETTDPVAIVATSVVSGSTVYDIPKTVVIDTTKELTEADIRFELVDGQAVSPVDYDQTITGTKVTLTLKNPLQRRKVYKLSINDLEAVDKGLLVAPQVVNFKTSGGPKVVSANIGNKSVPDGKSVVLGFDQPLLTPQDISSAVSVTVRGQAAPVQVVIGGNQITIKPSTGWGLCTPFTIKINASVKSNFGIDGDSTWQINSRTTCYSISTIGYSAGGRPIQAWRFGSGATKLLFVGATHGNERSTKLLLEEWIRELDANPSKVPANKTLIIIPAVNPDGVAAVARLNGRGVDLNRNFPANDWKSDVTMPGGGGPVTAGAGASPLSEPESRALANFVLAERPVLTLTYHSVASVVSGNNSGSSNSLAMAYAQQSRYRYLPKSDTNVVFQYDTTGAFEDWLHDKHDLAGLLIELGSDTRSDFARHKGALWSLVTSL